MNARIQELWEQGTFTVIPREGDYSIVTAGSIKSFAELIVRECASLCEARAWGMIEKGFPGHEAVEGCSDTIKDHFGVGE